MSVLIIVTGVCPPAAIVAEADTARGPLMQAALVSLNAEPSKSLPPRSGKSRIDWVPVTRLRPEGEVIFDPQLAAPGNVPPAFGQR